jgi:hypothetical protein
VFAVGQYLRPKAAPLASAFFAAAFALHPALEAPAASKIGLCFPTRLVLVPFHIDRSLFNFPSGPF